MDRLYEDLSGLQDEINALNDERMSLKQCTTMNRKFNIIELEVESSHANAMKEKLISLDSICKELHTKFLKSEKDYKDQGLRFSKLQQENEILQQENQKFGDELDQTKKQIIYL